MQLRFVMMCVMLALSTSKQHLNNTHARLLKSPTGATCCNLCCFAPILFLPMILFPRSSQRAVGGTWVRRAWWNSRWKVPCASKPAARWMSMFTQKQQARLLHSHRPSRCDSMRPAETRQQCMHAPRPYAAGFGLPRNSRFVTCCLSKQ